MSALAPGLTNKQRILIVFESYRIFHRYTTVPMTLHTTESC